MMRVLLADDESVIVEGLKRLIHWEDLDAEIIDTAHDGEELEEKILARKPDLVVTDVKMPKRSGLDVIRQVQGKSAAKFIFISGYQEFSYAQTALKYGAVDYLLKPVRARELEQAVRKTITQIEDQNTVEIFRGSKDEIQELFRNMNSENRYEGEELYEVFASSGIDFTDKIIVGLCIGPQPDVAAERIRDSFEHYNLLRFAIFNRLSEYFSEHRNGFVVKRDDYALHVLGVFPREEQACYFDQYIRPELETLETEYQLPLTAGIGIEFQDLSQMKNSYKTAQYCFELFFFLEQKVIDFQHVNKVFVDSEKIYDDAVAQLFPAIVARDGSLEEKVEKVMDVIEDMHFGHMMAAKSRVMLYTGDISSKLTDLHMINNDFYAMQDALQNRVAEASTFRQLREIMKDYFRNLMEEVEKSGRNRDSILIEDVKEYISLHYMEDLSIRKLAEVACVSQNYFSAMFKKETGENYKSYLTGVRMDAAMKLLQETDCKTYEISDQIGYNNVRRFVDAFKQIYKVSPAEYRKLLKTGQPVPEHR